MAEQNQLHFQVQDENKARKYEANKRKEKRSSSSSIDAMKES